ncbi:hypothetical protein DFH09DRAFT_1318236 [Mycena vulgaris]|nr:hypothetical protein DFH09DRAFT_1318236 [Mycena vulgaris]
MHSFRYFYPRRPKTVLGALGSGIGKLLENNKNNKNPEISVGLTMLSRSPSILHDRICPRDRDDEHPISRPIASSSSLHPFSTGTAKPVGIVAGSRRSTRTSRPSARLTDPNNAESSVSSVIAGKRKATVVIVASHKVPRLSGSDSGASDECDVESDADASGKAFDDDAEGENGASEGQDAMDLQEYHAIKAMADADHAEITAKVTRADSTANIGTVFTRVKERKNPKTGNLDDGSLYKICVYVVSIILLIDLSVLLVTRERKTFMTGSVTSLRLHIARHKAHYEIYKARCEKLGIEVDEHVIPRALEGVVVSTPRPPPFPTRGLLDFITELVVTQDEICIEHPSFRRLLKCCRLAINENDIPTRKTLRTHILARAKEVEQELCILLRLMSASQDAWPSASGIPFVNVNAHYILAPVDR